jgi:TATA-binding protein-associated factor
VWWYERSVRFFPLNSLRREISYHTLPYLDGATESENAYGHESWSNDLAAKLLCVFVLDRFGDFVSDQVVAPVRETVSQTLASLLLHMPRRSVAHVHSILLQMIRQDFLPGGMSQSVSTAVMTTTTTPGGVIPGARRRGETHVWEVRHAGLLGIKYEVAVRSDLFESLKGEGEEGGTQMLQDVVDAAILG